MRRESDDILHTLVETPRESAVCFSIVVNRENQLPQPSFNIFDDEKSHDGFIRVSSSGRLLGVRGRYVNPNEQSDNAVPFEISLSAAKDLRTEDVSPESSDQYLTEDIKDLIKNPRVFIIEASKFDALPAPCYRESAPEIHLKLIFITGQYQSVKDTSVDQAVVLCKGQVDFKSSGSDTSKEDAQAGPRLILDHIVLLTSNVEIKARRSSSVKGNPSPDDNKLPPASISSSSSPSRVRCRMVKSSSVFSLKWIKKVVMKIVIISLVFALLFTPSVIHDMATGICKSFGLSSDLRLETAFVTLSVSGTFKIVLTVLRVLLALVIVLLAVATPVRWDLMSDLSRYVGTYTRSILGLSNSAAYDDEGLDYSDCSPRQERQKLSFFVNGWNAWSFSGAISQGQTFPLYAMPHKFVKAFHDGSPSMKINLGLGTNASKDTASGVEIESTSKSSNKRDYIASDMFAVIADTHTKQGVICGFLSQKEQFGCVAINKSYDHISVHVDCDGVPLSPSVSAKDQSGEDSHLSTPVDGGHALPTHARTSLHTDWFCVIPQSRLDDDALGVYLELSGRYNRVQDMYSAEDLDLTPIPVESAPKVDLRAMLSTWKSVKSIRGTHTSHSTHNLNDNVNDKKEDTRDHHVAFNREASGVVGGGGKGGEGEGESTVMNKVPAGWCSWYHFFEHVSEADLTSNIVSMQALKKEHGMSDERLGFSLFQVDDGYQRAWGDWLLLNEKRFPSQSMNIIVEKTRDALMTPGLWMAPFACDKHSKLAADHPDWILCKDINNKKNKKNGTKNTAGTPSNSANCGKWFYGLDVTNPEVRAHIHKCISTAVQKWGFRYLKLDFLYAAALSDAHSSYQDQTITRAQAMQIGLDTISTAMGKDVFLLGCGAPMGSVVGRVHANRVSADAGLSWLPPFPLPFYDKWNLPCARNMVRNSICRMSMHGRWWINDPDCMLLRNTTEFTDEEIVSIATVKALSGGSFIISDDLATVPVDRLRLAQQLLPATNKAAVPLDLLDREMPEILRLNFEKNYSTSGSNTTSSSISSGSSIHMDNIHRNSSSANWTLLATCNWDDEDEKFPIISAKDLNLLPVDSTSSRVPVILHILEFWSGEYSYRVIHPSDVDMFCEGKNKKEQEVLKKNKKSSVRKVVYKIAADRLLAKQLGTSVSDNEDVVLPTVPKHGAKLYTFRLTYGNNSTKGNSSSSSSSGHSNGVQYIGSNLHFSCGLEVKSMTCSTVETISNNQASSSSPSSSSSSPRRHSCEIVFESGAIRPAEWEGYIWVFLPAYETLANSLNKGILVDGPAAATAAGKRSGLVPSVAASIADTEAGAKGIVWKIPVGYDATTSADTGNRNSGNMSLTIHW